TLTQVIATSEPWNTDLENYQYPVHLDIQGELVPMAFLNSYVSWLNITQEDLMQSANLESIRQSWRTIHDLAGDDACIVIAYFPSKPQIYLPYVVEEDRPRINVGQVQRVAEPNAEILIAEIEPTYETLLER